VKTLDELAALSKARSKTLSYVAPGAPHALFMEKWKAVGDLHHQGGTRARPSPAAGHPRRPASRSAASPPGAGPKAPSGPCHDFGALCLLGGEGSPEAPLERTDRVVAGARTFEAARVRITCAVSILRRAPLTSSAPLPAGLFL
jgi:hypothetical protein